MTETWPQAVKRRWHNITNAIHGIDEYVDDDGTLYVGPEVDEYLNRKDDDA
jgi:hypothetical protein